MCALLLFFAAAAGVAAAAASCSVPLFVVAVWSLLSLLLEDIQCAACFAAALFAALFLYFLVH